MRNVIETRPSMLDWSESSYSSAGLGIRGDKTQVREAERCAGTQVCLSSAMTMSRSDWSSDVSSENRPYTSFRPMHRVTTSRVSEVTGWLMIGRRRECRSSCAVRVVSGWAPHSSR